MFLADQLVKTLWLILPGFFFPRLLSTSMVLPSPPRPAKVLPAGNLLFVSFRRLKCWKSAYCQFHLSLSLSLRCFAFYASLALEKTSHPSGEVHGESAGRNTGSQFPKHKSQRRKPVLSQAWKANPPGNMNLPLPLPQSSVCQMMRWVCGNGGKVFPGENGSLPELSDTHISFRSL